ncbi:FliG C-terminal domain-containing protein [Naasia sp. SYSU D00057]|uniref:flagellar motor switch protein FliG n=1 Tax=Naasia sp. SYSU D00057 TaxID=2817380 RepID=UPI001B303C07|nr:FliG C-terminal domain-containing protein [Naasia sp. SYSU D00057]
MTATRTLTGTQKAALVIMNLSTEHAAVVMRQFSEQEAEEITAEIVRLRNVDAETAETAIREFSERSIGRAANSRGGRDFAAGLLEASFGAERAQGFLERLDSGSSFEFLDGADAVQVSSLLDGELPETTAFVLTRVRTDLASAVLARLEPSVRVDVAQAIATMGTPTPEAVSIVTAVLKQRARAIVLPQEKVQASGGVQPLVDIIKRSDAATERDLLAALEERDSELAEQVKSRMLGFDDIVTLEERDVQQVLRSLDPAMLAIAMKGASQSVIETVRGNMSERNRTALDEETELLGRVLKGQVDEARSQVVRAIRDLEASGTITVHRAAEEEEYVD